MHSIAIFNNKGGVGKTTLLCNVAAYLSLKLSKSVLVIDADPQCNATQSVYDDDEIEEIYKRKNIFTIQSIARPLAVGKGYSEALHPRSREDFGFDILLGDPRLALIEDTLAKDWGDATAGDTRGIRTTFMFRQLLERCKEYDFVIFDMGPALGSINRSVLLAVDSFIVPMSIDIFSLRASENISSWIKQWKKRLQTGLSNAEYPEDLEVSTSWKLNFLGYTTQQYTAKRISSDGGRRGVKAYDSIMKKIPKYIKKDFIDLFGQEGDPQDYELGSIPYLHSMVPLSQERRKPIFQLKAKDGVVGAHFTKVREAESIFGKIAERITESFQ